MNPELRKKIGQYKANKFKQDLPEYKDGGKKIAAGLAGFASGLPGIGPVIDATTANTDLIKDNPIAVKAGKFGATVIGEGVKMALNPMSAISGAPKIIGSGLDLGSTVAEEKGNTQRADRLDTAAMGMQGVGQVAGMATGMIGQFGGEGGFNFGQMMGGGQGQFNPMQMFGGGTPVEMKDGGPLNKSNKKDLIKYNGATHENSPIGGIPIAENGQQLNSGFKSQIPANTKAFAEHGEAYSKDKEYIFSHNPEFKDMNGKTPADKIKAASQIIKGRENDSIAQNSYKRMEARIIEENENMRMKKEIKSNPLMMAKNGGNLPKYNDGAYFNPYGLGSGTVDTFGTNHVEDANTMTPSFALGTTTIPSIMERNNKKAPVANTAAITPTNNNQQFTTGDYMQLGAGALTGITNLAMGLKKPDTFKPLTSSYFGSGLNDMNQNVRFNTNPILMNRNVGTNQINQGSTSDAVRRANLQSLFRGTNTQLGEMAEKEALANVGIKQQLGQAKLNVGQQDVAAQERARGLNIQAKATAQNLRAQGLEDIYGSIGEVGKGMNVRQGNTIKLNVLNSLASQYGVDPKTLEIIFKNQGITTTK